MENPENTRLDLDKEFLQQYDMLQNKPLGKGNFGVIYYVQRKGTFKKLAVKVTDNYQMQINSEHKRFLKMENLLLHDNQIKIADFGLSRKLQESEQYATTVAGSRAYCAPQVFNKERYTIKCDVYSLGTIFYQMITGKAPYLDPVPKNNQQLLQRIRNQSLDYLDIQQNEVQVSDTIKELLSKMLQYDEKDRLSIKQVWEHEIFANKIHFKEDLLDKYNIYSYNFHKNVQQVYENEDLIQDDNVLNYDQNIDFLDSNYFQNHGKTQNNQEEQYNPNLSPCELQNISNIISQSIQDSYFYQVNLIQLLSKCTYKIYHLQLDFISLEHKHVIIPSFLLLKKQLYQYLEILQDIEEEKNSFKIYPKILLYEHQSIIALKEFLNESIGILYAYLESKKIDILNYAKKNINEETQKQQKEVNKQSFDKESDQLFIAELQKYYNVIQNLAQQQDNECQKRQLKLHQIDILECLKTKESQNPQSLKKRDNQKKLLLAGSIQKIDYYIEEQKLYTH
ncbi:Protein kinase-like domain [Pseudocohnilembus persalinus]|uniref:Protein kinase-like domain n=1 Tax=Pseudocohnilembus persalinus TaxID=266149 RepID=A0A0V0QYW9_PSEPJ|nr:Protein kinase-like domain [Pseudocohnilembus persalinus]|eukprot:KRX07428.1 Protein kinase-like domain [Pseudocohnilembus persalinus]